MNCQDYEGDLSGYVDGTLNERARMTCEAHLAACERCRGLAADLKSIQSAALALGPADPPPFLWTRISAAVAGERDHWSGWAIWQSVVAATVAVTLVAALSWVGSRLVPVNDQRSAAASLAGAPGETSVGAEFDLAEAQLTQAIAGLESIAATDQSTLDMDTADVLKANLTVIDGAIVESRAALRTEPDNQVARDSLFDALARKVELLQDMVALINEMRKGNTEGAARIVSGMNQ